MKNIILVIVLQVYAFSAFSQHNRNPSVLLSTDVDTKILSITFDKNQTVVKFENKNLIKKPTYLSSTIYAVDDDGVKHKAIGFDGMTLEDDKTTYKQTSTLFTVCFATLPKGTKSLDIVSDDRFSLYGINPEGTPHPVIPKSVGCVDSSEIAEGLFYSKPTVVTGHINLKGLDKETVYFIQDDIVDGILTDTKPARIDSNGNFKLNLEIDHPIWTYLAFNKNGNNEIASVYIHPGDTLELDIDNENCSYNNKSGRLTCEKLMKYYPGSYLLWADTLVDKMTRDSFVKLLSEKESFANQLADYLCWKYSFSPWETYLYKQQIQLNYTAHLLRYNVVLDANIHRKENTHMNTESSDYSFLSRMNPNDISYCALSFYYPILCQMQNIDEFSKIRGWGLQNLNYGEGMEAGIKTRQSDWINATAGWESGLSYLMQGAIVVGMNTRIHSNSKENTEKENEKLFQLFTHPYFLNNAIRIGNK